MRVPFMFVPGSCLQSLFRWYECSCCGARCYLKIHLRDKKTLQKIRMFSHKIYLKHIYDFISPWGDID